MTAARPGPRPVIPPARVVFSEDDRARILALVDRALSTGSLTLGPCGEAFEEAFAARHGQPHAVATSSGTSALEIILRSLGVAGRDVVVPANTFYATAAAVVHAGARPVFADVEGATLSASRATVEAALTPATAAVVVVHIGGLVSPEMPAIAALCSAQGIALVEDAAHAHGSSLKGRPAGSWGQAAAFSFYPTKVVASAEGGMILTGDEQLAGEARIYRDQGKASFLGGGHVRLGSAWRMSEVHAAIGLVHLDRLDEFVTARRRVAARYDAALAGAPQLTLLPEPGTARSNYYKYPVLLDAGMDRAALKAELREQWGVGLSGEVYATPLHHEPVLAPYAGGPLPVAEDVCARQVCLPVHSDMTDGEIDRVVEAMLAALVTAAAS
ncbi:MAG: DegT/DnrJ/EryC1/StrS family aminotransferase [Acidimicrobiaceae bacterium]|nr:DegT/DnrJ/EryC1/StrS family aminotransferase [Acidimicrobiaceae bacterium]